MVIMCAPVGWDVASVQAILALSSHSRHRQRAINAFSSKVVRHHSSIVMHTKSTCVLAWSMQTTAGAPTPEDAMFRLNSGLDGAASAHTYQSFLMSKDHLNCK